MKSIIKKEKGLIRTHENSSILNFYGKRMLIKNVDGKIVILLYC